MNYTRILNQRLKKAGRDYRKGQETEKSELLFREIREVREEAEETGSFLPWSEAAERLGWSREEEGLICVLWSARGEELTRQEFEDLAAKLADRGVTLKTEDTDSDQIWLEMLDE